MTGTRRAAPLLSRTMLLAALAAPAALFSTGCSGSTPTSKTAQGQGGTAVTPIEDAQFATAARRVLAAPDGSDERDKILARVAAAQLEHAALRFDRGDDDAGLRSVRGAFLLIRRGETSGALLAKPGSPGDRALAGAIRVVSSQGDEGSARALLDLRRLTALGDDKARVEESLRALDAWATETRTGSAVEITGLDERAAVGRAMIDSSPAALKAAEEAISKWIGAAIENRLAYQQTGRRPPPREAIEATRALGSGPVTLVALYLRHGDAAGALDAIERTSARRIVQPAFYAVLQEAASAKTSRPWKGLWAALEEETQGQVGGDFGIEPAAYEAARLYVALEAWRVEPADAATSLVLAEALASFGMPEVSPLVLGDALKGNEDPAFASAVTRFVGVALRDQVSDVATARRVFAASTEILDVVGASSAKGGVRPTPTDLRELMGGIELRAGQLDAARPLLEAVARDAPSASSYLALAMLERQAQKGDAALGWTTRATSEPFATAEPLDAAEAAIVAYEIHRAKGSTAEAERTLEIALRHAVTAEKAGKAGPPKARAERSLARVLDAYGDTLGATRALERAITEVSGDRKLLGATFLDAIARAMVRRDLEAARGLLRRALDARVEADDLIYGALWVKLLEGTLRASPDGTVASALLTSGEAPPGSWTAKLTRWGTGKLSDAELAKQAQSGSQRVEAAFYQAMAKRAAGDQSSDAGLRDVATSAHLDLVEVQLARELLFPPMRIGVPRNVQLP